MCNIIIKLVLLLSYNHNKFKFIILGSIMKIEFDALLEKLKNNNIRLSHQRLKVLEYMTTSRLHPTADQIYTSLHEEIPTLSKTTVYNTMNSLEEAGIVKIVNIDDNEVRYDIITNNHGHFKCKSCHAIYDFEVDLDNFASSELQGFEIDNKKLYFDGICPSCLEKKKLI